MPKGYGDTLFDDKLNAALEKQHSKHPERADVRAIKNSGDIVLGSSNLKNDELTQGLIDGNPIVNKAGVQSKTGKTKDGRNTIQ